MEKSNQIRYYPALDLLRFIGAAIILIYHYHHFYFYKVYFGPTNGYPTWENSRQPFYEFLTSFYHSGYWAVQFFWLLSGFVFAFVYLKRKVSAKEFFILRFSRLYPLHFLSLIVITALQYSSLGLLGSFQLIEINDLYHFILNLFYAQYWGFQEGYSFNSVSWSISLEELVYWGFWIAAIKLKVKSFSGIAFITIIAFLLNPLFSIYSDAFFFFFGGATIYLIHSKITTFQNIFIMIGCVFSTILFLFIINNIPELTNLLSIEILPKFQPFFIKIYYFLFFSSLVFLFAYIDKQNLLTIRQQNFCRKAGSLTYSTYMLHLPIQILILIVFDYFNISRDLFDLNIVFLFYFIFMLYIGRISFTHFERPIQKYIRKRFEK